MSWSPWIPLIGQSEILLSTKAGKAIHFKEDEVRPTGRVAGGVRGIKLDAGDEVLRGPLVPRLPLVVTFSTSGYARRTPWTTTRCKGAMAAA